MSLFGTPSPEGSPDMRSSNFGNGRPSLFEDEPPMTRSTTTALFADDDAGSDSPWDMPTPRRQQTRADVLRNLLANSTVPDSYIDVFEKMVAEDGSAGRISAGGVAKTLAAAKLGADDQARIMSIVAPGGSAEDVSLDRNQFNVLLALIGLAQEGEPVSLDTVDERRRDLPRLKLHGIVDSTSALAHAEELAAKPPQRPATPPRAPDPVSPARHRSVRKPSMEYPEDPWNTPDLHRNHDHGPEAPRLNGHDRSSSAGPPNGNAFPTGPQATLPRRTTSTFTTNVPPSGAGSVVEAPGAWGAMDGRNAPATGGGFNEQLQNPAAPFGGIPTAGGASQETAGVLPPAPAAANRTIGGGRNGAPVQEHIIVTLMPEKEGMFLFQHHNYEVTSTRRGSKVIRRYSDFVWLLDCLHKRYPFRVLPLLPPKRVAVNGNHLSNDGAFIEKRRRGLARFLNALVRHPVLSQEQLVIMFLTVPTELSVWRKQATISVQDEFTGRPLPPGLEDSLPPSLEDLFARTRAGVKRSAELYITICNLMDRLVKRTEGVAADHARLALSLLSLTEASADTYATDTNDVPLLNDGLQAMSRHLRTAQSLMEDESRAWESGVLEDLKRQRDALVSLRDLFDRRERLDKDNIPYLEKRIAANESKLASLRAKPEGLVKPGEIEKVVEAIIKDKESIVNQHNRSVFVKECLRDELIYFQHTQYNVSRWNQDWAQERIKYSEMLADNWRRLLDGLEGMPLGD
ncbi:hypothetical protein MYCTH_2303134 [Thermothelomyces thermophilus ATCC 42464]|uniref:Sorting nexin MVP1 n=1 Tax=Thermothelomyces thermophilus (strain ATCC 42464 / BCRC 31852 / DSM 1799) TaxID=573729 RepID=G2QC10_THET4|nr:uncharacterized protein MYCTH_2303134 [Thermothelomyces thermophilus ATCC 42464]AEO57237.1 hypothetical protein MYCTH_2303134 [Thermothelomyces thermophilus ATCC 42464]